MPTREDDIERRIEAAQDARESRTLTGPQMDGQAADAVVYDDPWTNARRTVSRAQAWIDAEGQR